MKRHRQPSLTKQVDDGYAAFLARRGLAPMRLARKLTQRQRQFLNSDLQTPRQDELVSERARLREQRKLKPGEPLPGHTPAVLLGRRPDFCPVCGHAMKWFPARHAWICPRPTCN